MKSFKEFLTETPYLNSYHTPDKVDSAMDIARKEVVTTHSHTTEIGVNKFKVRSDKGHYYYHMNDGKPKEISHITIDNVHNLTSKGAGGDSDHIKHFMIHHASMRGLVKSDTQQTHGSRKLWSSLIKSEPKNMTFHHVTHNGETEITSNNLDSLDRKIWTNKTTKHDDHLEMRHVK